MSFYRPPASAWSYPTDWRQCIIRTQISGILDIARTTAAVSTLLKIMVDAQAPSSVRVRAADSVLDHAKQAIEIEDVEVRVAALERAAEISQSGEH